VGGGWHSVATSVRKGGQSQWCSTETHRGVELTAARLWQWTICAAPMYLAHCASCVAAGAVDEHAEALRGLGKYVEITLN
jgi:hypothetical protein